MVRVRASLAALAVATCTGSLAGCGRIDYDARPRDGGPGGDASQDAGPFIGEWLRIVSSLETAFPRSEIDSQGNVAFSTSVRGTGDVEGGLGLSSAVLEGLVVSYTEAGDWRWQKSLTSTVRLNPYDLHIGPGDDFYIAGLAAGDNVVGGMPLAAGSRQNILLAHYDTNGDVLDARLFSGGSANAQGHAVAANTDGTLVIAGVFAHELDFGGEFLTGNGTDNGYGTSMTASMEPLWSRAFLSNSITHASVVDIGDDGVSCVGGFFSGDTSDFGDDQTYGVVNDNGQSDVFVAQYSPDGALLALNQFGGEGADRIGAIARDPNGGCIVGLKSCSAAGCDAVVARVDAQGSVDWSRTASGVGTEQVNDLAIGSSGTIYLAGHFTEDISFAGESFTRADTSSGKSGFYGAVSMDGTPLWLRTLDGANIGMGSIAITADEAAVVVSGTFQGALTHAGRTEDSGGDSHAYLARVLVPSL